MSRCNDIALTMEDFTPVSHSSFLWVVGTVVISFGLGPAQRPASTICMSQIHFKREHPKQTTISLQVHIHGLFFAVFFHGGHTFLLGGNQEQQQQCLEVGGFREKSELPQTCYSGITILEMGKAKGRSIIPYKVSIAKAYIRCFRVQS